MIRLNLLNKGLLAGVIVTIVTMVGVENVFSATVNNPMTTNLDGGGYNISNVTNLDATSVVTTDVITKGPWVDARAYNAGTFNDTTITAALNAIGTSQKTLLLAPGTWQISNFITIPSNVNLRFEGGAILNISLGTTVTINGSIDAPISLIFSGSGTVGFGPGYVKEVYPQWWGAVGDNSHDDTSAIQAAVNAFSGGGTVYIPQGMYKTTNEIDVTKHGTSIKGAGWTRAGTGGTFIKLSLAAPANIYAFDVIAREVSFEDIAIVGDGYSNGGVVIRSVPSLLSWAWGGFMKRVLFQDFVKSGAAGITFGVADDASSSTSGWRLFGVVCDRNYNGAKLNIVTLDTSFFGCKMTGNDFCGIHAVFTWNIGIYGGDYQNNKVNNIRIEGSTNGTILNTYHESNYWGGGYIVANHKCIYVTPYNDPNPYPSHGLTIKGNYFNSSADGVPADYAIEVVNYSMRNGEISNNIFGEFNIAAIKMDVGNSGVAINNDLVSEGRVDSEINSKLFNFTNDANLGWQITNARNVGTKGSIASDNNKRVLIPALATTTVLTVSPVQDSSYMIEVNALFRRMPGVGAVTNGYKIFTIVERDGLSAPTIVGETNTAHEDVAGDALTWVVNGNNIELRYTESAGIAGELHFSYSIVGVRESP